MGRGGHDRFELVFSSVWGQPPFAKLKHMYKTCVKSTIPISKQSNHPSACSYMLLKTTKYTHVSLCLSLGTYHIVHRTYHKASKTHTSTHISHFAHHVSHSTSYIAHSTKLLKPAKTHNSHVAYPMALCT